MNEKQEHTNSDFITYKGYPLVRKEDEIYFGSMTDEYFVRMQIIHKSNYSGINVADKIRVYKVSTNEKLNVEDAIIRSGEKTNLYEALDLAVAWLRRKE
jgi:hypothetical protein